MFCAVIVDDRYPTLSILRGIVEYSSMILYSNEVHEMIDMAVTVFL